MKTRQAFHLLRFSSVLLLSFLACTDLGNGPPPPPQLRPLSNSELQLVKSTDRFWLKIFKTIESEDRDKSVFISPLSISMALGMTLNGANGETRDSMLKTLEVTGLTEQEINQAYQSLIRLLQSVDPAVQFQIANSIWVKSGFPVEQEFINTNRTYFDAEISSLDFQSSGAADMINSWVSEKTNHKIRRILDSIPEEIVMYLINALYFKGAWTEPFDPQRTYDGEFTLRDGSKTSCRMMRQEERTWYYYRNEEVEVIDLPYGNTLFSMTIILPKEGVDVSDYTSSFTHAKYDTILQNLHEYSLVLMMPKFKLEYEKNLKDPLKKLGMNIAFDPYSADFTRINRQGDLFISEAFHKTFVEVNEEGTEAAAVTVIGVGVTSGPPVMIVNRPFLFVIRERTSGTVLFAGKILNPS